MYLLTYRPLRRVRCASVRIPQTHRASTTTPQSPSWLALRLRTRIGRALRSSLRRVLEIFADHLRLQREYDRARIATRNRSLRAHQVAPHAFANFRSRA